MPAGPARRRVRWCLVASSSAVPSLGPADRSLGRDPQRPARLHREGRNGRGPRLIRTAVVAASVHEVLVSHSDPPPAAPRPAPVARIQGRALLTGAEVAVTTARRAMISPSDASGAPA